MPTADVAEEIHSKLGAQTLGYSTYLNLEDETLQSYGTDVVIDPFNVVT